MNSIFACDLGLNRKTSSRNFFCCFVFRFREIFFNQHWRQMRASLILLFGKTKAFFGKDTARKKTAFLHTLFVENERETSKLKWGAMFFYKVEGHMPKLSSFGRGKKFRPKKSLTSLLHAALQLKALPMILIPSTFATFPQWPNERNDNLNNLRLRLMSSLFLCSWIVSEDLRDHTKTTCRPETRRTSGSHQQNGGIIEVVSPAARKHIEVSRFSACFAYF